MDNKRSETVEVNSQPSGPKTLLPPFSSLTTARSKGVGNHSFKANRSSNRDGFPESLYNGDHQQQCFQQKERWYNDVDDFRHSGFYNQQPPDMSTGSIFGLSQQACTLGAQSSSQNSGNGQMFAPDLLPQIPLSQIESLLSAAEQKPTSFASPNPSQVYESRQSNWDGYLGPGNYHSQSPLPSYPGFPPFYTKSSDALSEVLDVLPSNNEHNLTSGGFYSTANTASPLYPLYPHQNTSNNIHFPMNHCADTTQAIADLDTFSQLHPNSKKPPGNSNFNSVHHQPWISSNGQMSSDTTICDSWKQNKKNVVSDTGQTKRKKARQKKKKISKSDLKPLDVINDNDTDSPGQCLSPTFIASLSSKRVGEQPSHVTTPTVSNTFQHSLHVDLNDIQPSVPNCVMNSVHHNQYNRSYSSLQAICIRPPLPCPTTSAIITLPSNLTSSQSNNKLCKSLSVDVCQEDGSSSPYQLSPAFLASLSSKKGQVKQAQNSMNPKVGHFDSSTNNVSLSTLHHETTRSLSPNPISPGFLNSLSSRKPYELTEQMSTLKASYSQPTMFSENSILRPYRSPSIDMNSLKFQYPTPPMDFDYNKQQSPVVGLSPPNNVLVQGLTPPSENGTPPLPTPPSSAELKQPSPVEVTLSKEEQTSRILEIIAREREKANSTLNMTQEPKKRKKKRKTNTNISQGECYSSFDQSLAEFYPGSNPNLLSVLEMDHVSPKSTPPPPALLYRNTSCNSIHSMASRPQEEGVSFDQMPILRFNCDQNLNSGPTARHIVTLENHGHSVVNTLTVNDFRKSEDKDPYVFDDTDTGNAERDALHTKVTNSKFAYESSDKDNFRIDLAAVDLCDKLSMNAVNRDAILNNNQTFLQKQQPVPNYSSVQETYLVKLEPFETFPRAHQMSPHNTTMIYKGSVNESCVPVQNANLKRSHKVNQEMPGVVVKEEPQGNVHCYSQMEDCAHKYSQAAENKPKVKTESKKKIGRPSRLASVEIPEKCKAADKKPNVSAASKIQYRVNGVEIKPDDLKLDQQLVDRLTNNLMEVADCSCLSPHHIPSEAIEGPYYTQLGAARDVPAVRKMMEQRTGVTGSALRIEKVIFTGKEGKSKEGCPVAKWIIRRSGPEEKYLCVVRQRPGHFCDTTVIIVVIVAWEGVMAEQADSLYNFLITTLPKSGIETDRRCGLNEKKTCACQGVDLLRRGASFSFGCSWSMYYNGCKFARSQSARKFKLKDVEMEEELGDKLERLATDIAPLYSRLAPDAYRNQTQFEKQAGDCRLGACSGRPFSGVTAVVDFCCHSHRDCHNMNNGSTVVVNLTKHRGFEKPDDEQYHVLPMYILDQTDETGSMEGQMDKIHKGSLEVLSRYMTQVRTRSTPYRPCKRNRTTPKKQGFQKSPKKPKFGRAMSYPPVSGQGLESPVSDGSCDGMFSPVTEVKNNLCKNMVAPGVGLDIVQQENMTYTDLMSQQGKPGFTDLYTKFWDYFYTHGVFPPRRWTAGSSSAFPVTPEKHRYSPFAHTVIQPSSADQVFLHQQQMKQSSNQEVLGGKTREHNQEVLTQQQHRSNSLNNRQHMFVNNCTDQHQLRQHLSYSFPLSVKQTGSVASPPGQVNQWSVLGHPAPSQSVQTSLHIPPTPGSSKHTESFGSPDSVSHSMPSHQDSFKSHHGALSVSSEQTSDRAVNSSSIGTLKSPPPYCETKQSDQAGNFQSNCKPHLYNENISQSILHSTCEEKVKQMTNSEPIKSVNYWTNGLSVNDIPIVSRNPSEFNGTKNRGHAVLNESEQKSKPELAVEKSDRDNPVQHGNRNTLHEGIASLPPNIINTLLSSNGDYSFSPSAIQKQDVNESSIHLQAGDKVKVHKSEGFVVPSLGQGPREPPYQVIDSTIMSIATDDNKEVFEDPAMGGVAIALCHGAVLFEVAKRELHATTALKEPNRYQPKRISLVFYQHKNLNLARHGLEEYERKMEERKSQAEQAKLIEEMETNGFMKGELGELASFPNLTKGTFGKVFNFPDTKKTLFPLRFPRYLDNSTLEQITPVMFACMSIAFPRYMKEAFPNARKLPRLMNGYPPVKISSSLSDRRAGPLKEHVKLEEIEAGERQEICKSWSPQAPSVTSVTTSSVITRWVHDDTNVTGPYNHWIQITQDNSSEDENEAFLKEKMFESLSQLDGQVFGPGGELSDPEGLDAAREDCFKVSKPSAVC